MKSTLDRILFLYPKVFVLEFIVLRWVGQMSQDADDFATILGVAYFIKLININNWIHTFGFSKDINIFPRLSQHRYSCAPQTLSRSPNFYVRKRRALFVLKTLRNSLLGGRMFCLCPVDPQTQKHSRS